MNQFPSSLTWIPQSIKYLELYKTTTDTSIKSSFTAANLPNVDKLRLCTGEPLFRARLQLPNVRDVYIRVYYISHANENIFEIVKCLASSDKIESLSCSTSQPQLLNLVTPRIGMNLKSLELASSVIPASKLKTRQASILIGRPPKLERMGMSGSLWSRGVGREALTKRPELELYFNHSLVTPNAVQNQCRYPINNSPLKLTDLSPVQ